MSEINNPTPEPGYAEAIRQEHAEVGISPELERTVSLFQRLLGAEVEAETYEITAEDKERVARLEQITRREQQKLGFLAMDGQAKPRITVVSRLGE